MSALNSVDFIILSVLSALGITGVLAIVSPRSFARIASSCSRWVDSANLLHVFDKRVELDQCVLPYSRALGVLVVLSVSLLGYFWVSI